MAEFSAHQPNVGNEQTPGSYGGSFTRIADDDTSRSSQIRDSTYGFDRLNIFEPNRPKEQTCTPNKTFGNRSAYAYTQSSTKQVTANVSNYLERPLPTNNFSPGSAQQPKAGEIYSQSDLGNAMYTEPECESVMNKSSILDNPKENFR